MLGWLIFIFILQYIGNNVANDLQIEEKCYNEWFKPQCVSLNEIIFIEEAIYGRMELGKCLSSEDLLAGDKNNEKFFGCHINVTSLINKKCFGKSFCEVYISDEYLIVDDDIRPCFKGMFMYLKVNYRCVINYSFNHDLCLIPATSEDKQLLITLVESSPPSKYCGHKLKPWILEASSGQYIELQLIKHNLNKIADHKLKCHNGGYNIGYMLTDSKSNFEKTINSDNINNYNNNNKHENNITICIGPEKKHKNLLNVYTKSSKLELVLVKEIIPYLGIRGMIENYVLLKIKAIGCVDLIPPENAWLKRYNDLATVGCYSSRQTWTLKCNGNDWQGVIGNCSIYNSNLYEDRSEQIYSDKKSKKNASNDIQFLGIVAICGFGLALCMVIICIGCVYFKRLNTIKKNQADNLRTFNYEQHTSNYVIEPNTDTPDYGITNKSINNQVKDETAYFVLEPSDEK